MIVNAILLIVYGIAMWFVGALSYRWMVEKYSPDLSAELNKRVFSMEDEEDTE